MHPTMDGRLSDSCDPLALVFYQPERTPLLQAVLQIDSNSTRVEHLEYGLLQLREIPPKP